MTKRTGHMGAFVLREEWMPWKASSVMEERLRFVPRLLDGEARHARWTGKYPWRPGRMARRRTCNLQHSMFGRQVRSTDGRCPIGYPAPGPGRWVGRRLICKECGTAGSVNIVPKWHDRAGHSVPFTNIGKRETQLLKLTADRPFADPDKAARRLLEHARAFEPIQDGRI